MKILQTKTDYRDLTYNALQTLYYLLNSTNSASQIIESLDESFINILYDILDKYNNDKEIEKIIKDILKVLCLHSEILSKQISKFILNNPSQKRWVDQYLGTN
jgi:hypothetical protein